MAMAAFGPVFTLPSLLRLRGSKGHLEEHSSPAPLSCLSGKRDSVSPAEGPRERPATVSLQ